MMDIAIDRAVLMGLIALQTQFVLKTGA